MNNIVLICGILIFSTCGKTNNYIPDINGVTSNSAVVVADSLLVSIQQDGEINIYNFNSKENVQRIKNIPPISAIFSSFGETVAFGTESNELIVANVCTGEILSERQFQMEIKKSVLTKNQVLCVFSSQIIAIELLGGTELFSIANVSRSSCSNSWSPSVTFDSVNFYVCDFMCESLIAIDRKSGQINWKVPKLFRSLSFVVNSKWGVLLTLNGESTEHHNSFLLDPETGMQTKTIQVTSDLIVKPLIVDSLIYFYTDESELIRYNVKSDEYNVLLASSKSLNITSELFYAKERLFFSTGWHKLFSVSTDTGTLEYLGQLEKGLNLISDVNGTVVVDY